MCNSKGKDLTQRDYPKLLPDPPNLSPANVIYHLVSKGTLIASYEFFDREPTNYLTGCGDY